ncbi:MAG: universal stress protein [Syntrophobacteraceae bacterium]|jgi:hypothetical protein|nr:universal stress protein [Syntrophobacteraceae bacterium]
MGSGDFEKHSGMEGEERRKILVVGRGSTFSEEVMAYSIHLAARLDYALLALCVDSEHHWSADELERQARQATRELRRRAERHGIPCAHVVKVGPLGLAVEEVNHEAKRMVLVVMDSGVSREEVAREVTIPLFSVISHSLDSEGDQDMASRQIIQKQRLMGKTIGLGALTASLYAAVFWNADTLMQTFTRGGWYAAYPVATVFLFSFIHGAFAHNLWSLLGVEANQRPVLRETEQKVARRKKTVQKRPRAYAYVNPFHRIDR